MELTLTHWAIIAFIAYLAIRRFFFSSPETDLDANSASQPLEFTSYTPLTLQKFNGTDGTPVLIAVRNKVYDVSAGRNFYGPGGPYANFAGRDASRGLAKSSFEASMLTDVDQPIDKLDDLTPLEIGTLADWEQLFIGKYPVVGDLVENDKHR